MVRLSPRALVTVALPILFTEIYPGLSYITRIYFHAFMTDLFRTLLVGTNALNLVFAPRSSSQLLRFRVPLEDYWP